MGIAICDKCSKIIDLDENLEEYDFKTCKCIDCLEREEE